MSATCHRCGAFDPAGNIFRRQRIPFRGVRIYCPKCHTKLEEKLLFGAYALTLSFGLFGLIALWLNPTSRNGYFLVNVFLVQVVMVPSVVIHEFAHAVVGKLCGLTVLKIWIGRGKTLYRANWLGFDTEFKMIPTGGLAFLTHGFKTKLRRRYFLAILAGPLANAIILSLAWSFVSWRNFSLENAIQLPAFIVVAQILILVENLLPYRVQTALGPLNTDGLSLFQLLLAKSPVVLNSRFNVSDSSAARQTWTG